QVKVRVRQPLRVLDAVVPAGASVSDALLEVLRAELNVKEVRFLQRAEELVSLRGHPNFRALGKRFGGRTQDAAAAIRMLPSEQLESFRAGGELAIDLDGERFTLSADELDVRDEPRGDRVVEAAGGFTVALDPTIDEELRLEGLARELVNRIQRLRREAGFAVSDRIRIGIFAVGQLRAAVERHGDFIAGETLGVELRVAGPTGMAAYGAGIHDVDIDGDPARIGLERV
ncbi:MAG: DUF5915 domain-containing protein, partial [Longimicrobiales bacterium]